VIYGLTKDSLNKYEKVLGLDMDGTLIKVKSGSKYPTNSSDWKLWDDSKVIEKINEYNEKGYGIIIITN